MDTEKRKVFVLQPEGERVPFVDGALLIEALAGAGVLLQSNCGGSGRCGKCRVRVSGPPGAGTAVDAVEDQRLGARDLACGFRLACRVPAAEGLTVEVPPTSRLVLDLQDKPLTAALLGARPPACAAAHDGGRWALAVDLGTTTIGVYLHDREDGGIAASAAVRNPQGLMGADVISRIAAVMERTENRERLQRLAVGAIENVARELCRTAGCDPRGIARMTVVGNPTMIHLLFGLDPSGIGVAPYEPTAKGPHDVAGCALGFGLGERLEVYAPPLVSGFLGADVLAAALAVGFDRAAPGTLLVDMGTNGELLLKTDSGIWGTACATGPAFEGATIEHGMQAAAGAIEAVAFDADERLLLRVIPNRDGSAARPSGLCGSGVVSAVAALLATGRILPGGAFDPGRRDPRFRLENGRPAAFVLAQAAKSATGRPVLLTQKDIRAVQLAKGALATGIELLCRTAGVSKVRRVLLAGAFGNHLDLDASHTLGLLAGVPPADVEGVGNAAGAGAVRTLDDPTFKGGLKTLARRIRAVNLSADPAFQDCFVRNLLF